MSGRKTTLNNQTIHFNIGNHLNIRIYLYDVVLLFYASIPFETLVALLARPSPETRGKHVKTSLWHARHAEIGPSRLGRYRRIVLSRTNKRSCATTVVTPLATKACAAFKNVVNECKYMSSTFVSRWQISLTCSRHTSRIFEWKKN